VLSFQQKLPFHTEINFKHSHWSLVCFGPRQFQKWWQPCDTLLQIYTPDFLKIQILFTEARRTTTVLSSRLRFNYMKTALSFLVYTSYTIVPRKLSIGIRRNHNPIIIYPRFYKYKQRFDVIFNRTNWHFPNDCETLTTREQVCWWACAVVYFILLKITRNDVILCRNNTRKPTHTTTTCPGAPYTSTAGSEFEKNKYIFPSNWKTSPWRQKKLNQKFII
jgi:hypothetical protein